MNLPDSLPLFHVDAFSTEPFTGNPAAVIPLQDWLPTPIMQAIANENALSETAFFVPMEHSGHYQLRWFTPNTEVDLCGHATLATAWVLARGLYPSTGRDWVFHTRSGCLSVHGIAHSDALSMILPKDPPHAFNTHPPALHKLLTDIGHVDEVQAAMDLIICLPNESSVLTFQPALELIAQLDQRALIITAPADDYDFVCRVFAPGIGIVEDPVTGSAFCQLLPYWAQRLQQNILTGAQRSARGGVITGILNKDSVSLHGEARLYLQGKIFL